MFDSSSISPDYIIKILIFTAIIINDNFAISNANRLKSYRRWPFMPQTTRSPPHISCYECYGSLESCATDRRNLIGGPKIKRCGLFENQCLFRKDPYSNFVALTCSADCVPTAITFCCSSELCNCIGPSGCPVALPKSNFQQPEDGEATMKTPLTTSRLFRYGEDDYDSRLAIFVENFLQQSTTPAVMVSSNHFRFPHVHVGNYVKIPAKSLSFLEYNLPSTPTEYIKSTKRPQNRILTGNPLIMAAPPSKMKSTGLHCWQCSGRDEDCRMEIHYNSMSRAQIKACRPDETYCSLVEFGDSERTIEMECASKCTPFEMKHLKISCCTTSLCNCVMNGGNTGEDCRLLPASNAVMAKMGIGQHPPEPVSPTRFVTRPGSWVDKFRVTNTTTTTTTTTTSTVATRINVTTATISNQTEDNAPRSNETTMEAMTNATTSPVPAINTSFVIHYEEYYPYSNATLVDDDSYYDQGVLNCYFCYHCPSVTPPTDPETQAVECPEDKRTACVKAEANFVTLTRIDRYCSDICPTDTDLVKYHCCANELCNRGVINKQTSYLLLMILVNAVYLAFKL